MKKVLIGIGTLLVLVVIAIPVAPSFIDWNRYKAEIAAKVREQTGRDIAIDGDISLAVLWTPTLSVHKVRFANIAGGSAPDMASLESLDVRLAFAPLDWLSRNFQVQRIDLVQPTILLERLADGHANWELGNPAPSAAGAPVGGGPGPAIRLDSITIKNGTLIYREAAGGSEQRVDALNASFGADTLNGPFRADGSLTYRSVPIIFKLTSGVLAGDQPAQISGEVGLAKSDATAKFAGTVATAGPLAVNGRLDAASADLAAALDSLAPGASAGSPLALDKAAKIGGDVRYAAGGGEIQNFTVALGDMTAAGGVKFTAGPPAKADVKLSVNRLDLDKLLAAAGAPSAAPEPGAAGAFALPQGIDASLDLAVGAIGYRGGVINDAHLIATLTQGEVDLSRLSGLLPGGSSLSVTGTLAAAGGAPKFTGVLDGKADNLRGLLDWLQVAPPPVPADRLRSLAMTGKVTATPGTIELADLDVKLDSSRIIGGTTVALPGAGRANPAFGVGLAIDQLNLDAYLPPAAGAKAAAKDQKAGLPLQNLAPLAGIDANVELRVGKLTLNEQTLQGVHVDGTLQKGALTLRDLSVKDFAGGKGGLNGTITNLAGQPRFDTKFNLAANDAGKAFQLAGLPKTAPGKLGALKLDGSLSGGAQDVAYDVNFSIAGVGAAGEAKGKATGIGAGIPRIDTTFDVKAKDAGPLAALANLDPASASRLGAVSLTGTAASGANDVTYNVAVGLAGIGGQGQFAGKITGLSGTPQVDTKLNFAAQKPAPLLALLHMAGPTADKVGQLGCTGTMAGNADNMKLDLALQGFGGSAKVAGTVMAAAPPTRFDLTIAADHPEFRDLLASLVPGYQPQAGQLGPFSFAAKATGSTQSASLSGLSLKAGPTQLTGDMKYDGSYARPFVTANLRGGLVDLTPFSSPGRGGGAGGGERWSRDPLDLSILDAADADIDFAANRFVSGNTAIDNLQARLALRDGTLTITQITGNSYGGAINLTGKLVGRGLPTFNGHVVASNVDIGGVSGSSFVKGPVTLNADLTSSGASMAELMDALHGNGTVNGTVTVLGQLQQMLGVAALSVLGQQLSQLTGQQQVQSMTDYVSSAYQAFVGRQSALNGNFKINRGILNTQDLTLNNEQAKALMSGDANLSAWTIGMLVNIFSMTAQNPDQPCLMVDLAGILSSPTPRPRSGGGCGGSQASPGNPLGGLLPGVFGQQQQPQQPGGLPGALQGVLPGVFGGQQQQQQNGPPLPGAEMQPQPGGAIQPQPGGAIQPQPGGVVQPQPGGVTQPEAPAAFPAPGAETAAPAVTAPAQPAPTPAAPTATAPATAGQQPPAPAAQQPPAAAAPAQPAIQDQSGGKKKKKQGQSGSNAPAGQTAPAGQAPAAPAAQPAPEATPAQPPAATQQPPAAAAPAQPATPEQPAGQKKKKKQGTGQAAPAGQPAQPAPVIQPAPEAAPAPQQPAPTTPGAEAPAQPSAAPAQQAAPSQPAPTTTVPEQQPAPPAQPGATTAPAPEQPAQPGQEGTGAPVIAPTAPGSEQPQQ